jgi:hypothetical protein
MKPSPPSFVHLRQPKGSSLCGQTCVAMYLGITLEESVFWFNGKRSGTRTSQLCYVLRHQGVDIPLDSKLKVIYRGVKLPETGILKITWKPPGKKINQGHWILKVGNVVYDPELDGPVPIDSYLDWLPLVHGKVTSFLKLPNIDRSVDIVPHV